MNDDPAKPARDENGNGAAARAAGPGDPRNPQDPPAEYPTSGPETMVTVRFGKMQSRGRFRSRTPALIYGDRIVVQSERGVELGEVVFKAPRGEESRSMPVGWVLRRATDEDVDSHEALNERLDGPGPEFKFCAERIQALDLAMRLVDVERPFGGGKIIFYFTADGRIDFRALVRDLAKRFRTRIEMKQIGVRDEAKVLGDIADCGRELCCRTFLTKLQPISMRMAKVQKTTLDPAKISGRCGRLKCCLRYEYDAYLSLRESLPRAGARVQHERGLGVVAGMDILSQTVTVVFDEGDRDIVPVATLTPAPKGTPAAPRRERRPSPPARAEAPDATKASTPAPATEPPAEASDAESAPPQSKSQAKPPSKTQSKPESKPQAKAKAPDAPAADAARENDVARRETPGTPDADSPKARAPRKPRDGSRKGKRSDAGRRSGRRPRSDRADAEAGGPSRAEPKKDARKRPDASKAAAGERAGDASGGKPTEKPAGKAPGKRPGKPADKPADKPSGAARKPRRRPRPKKRPDGGGDAG